ncbi:MAG: hypothetical protein IJX84_08620 [Clostridia bacterium]|nr:hypothetical protein [Clostridia bacterium]
MYRPASARTLAFCVKADAERESLERYKADALWVLVDWVSRGKAKMLRYGEWLESIRRRERGERSAEDLRLDLIAALRRQTNEETIQKVDNMLEMFSPTKGE